MQVARANAALNDRPVNADDLKVALSSKYAAFLKKKYHICNFKATVYAGISSNRHRHTGLRCARVLDVLVS